ncbi:DUF1345 domain-containing protein [Dyadobacter sp. CY347]|uniref:DUF1345 domain-containing protein n=1 Tax=Dyadobacter sp. CY347 TaxID=2909336 RepID=UPI001F31F33A|nr:DUF1345 domain-containing protein [Dyadobacter sp. CY347]MCF2489114.1 DUF1345 domain-containing protein [Dyadobacter sp. CY347]
MKKIINRLDAHHKLGISLLFGAAAVILSSSIIERPINWMIGWLIYSSVHIGLMWVTILSSHPAEVRREVSGQDPSRVLSILFVVVASFVSLFAILFLLQGARSTSSWDNLTVHVILSFFCIICSWVLVHTVFTLRYAHMFYGHTRRNKEDQSKQFRGLEFPNEPEPDYLDFTYFSFVLGMTFQVSDVTISSREIRRLALVHGILSFAFNTLLVALTINVVSGLIQK